MDATKSISNYSRIPLNLQMFSEQDPTDPPEQDLELELPSVGENPSIQDSVTAAKESIVEAMTQVKQIEIEGLSAVINSLNQLGDKMSGLISQMENNLNMTEAHRLEALDLASALKEEKDARSHQQPGSQNESMIPPVDVQKHKQGWKSIL